MDIRRMLAGRLRTHEREDPLPLWTPWGEELLARDEKGAGQRRQPRKLSSHASSSPVCPQRLGESQRLVGVCVCRQPRRRRAGAHSRRTSDVLPAHSRALLARGFALGCGTPAQAGRAAVVSALVRSARARCRRTTAPPLRRRGLRMRLLREWASRGHAQRRLPALLVRRDRPSGTGREKRASPVRPRSQRHRAAPAWKAAPPVRDHLVHRAERHLAGRVVGACAREPRRGAARRRQPACWRCHGVCPGGAAGRGAARVAPLGRRDARRQRLGGGWREQPGRSCPR